MGTKEKVEIQKIINELNDFMLHFTWISTTQVEEYLYQIIIKLQKIID